MKRPSFDSVGKFILVLTLLACPAIGLSQSSTVRVGNNQSLVRQLDSKLMGRKMNYGVVFPSDHERLPRKRFPVLYLLHGLTGHFENWLARSSVADYIKDRDIIVVTPNGWYTDNLAKDGEKYESYIIKELIPEIDKKYRTLAGREGRWVAGLSMGGYGAIKFGLKYPDMFSVVGSFSGAIGAATITEKSFPGPIGKSIDAIFGPPDGVIRKANDPFDIIRSANAGQDQDVSVYLFGLRYRRFPVSE